MGTNQGMQVKVIIDLSTIEYYAMHKSLLGLVLAIDIHLYAARGMNMALDLESSRCHTKVHVAMIWKKNIKPMVIIV